MKQIINLFIIILLFSKCGSAIKNSNAEIVVEQGATNSAIAIERTDLNDKVNTVNHVSTVKTINQHELLGYWVGYFEQDVKKSTDRKIMFVDEGFFWNKENKINISIDEIINGDVKGHSVVAGNDRPFVGTIDIDSASTSIIYTFQVKEPGDDKYDGEFNFSIVDNRLIGKWQAYGEINIRNRKYSLEKRSFKYDPEILLERSTTYINWMNSTEKKENVIVDGDETYKWFSQEFETATKVIYKINASNTLLTKLDVQNLKKGDLTIIRNTIYARHGYSFRNQPLRVFFDAQSWYIPVHANIRNDFTDIEIKNIRLLLSYEKNAAEYYDSFGRG